MDRKRIIDMSQAHLIPERLREYALKIAETVAKNPVANGAAQRYFELLRAVEFKLRQEPEASRFFKKTLKKPNGKEGLKALREGNENWLEKRYPDGYFNIYSTEKLINTTWFPFFFTYIFDNDLEQRDALYSLVQHFAIPIQGSLEEFEIPLRAPVALPQSNALRCCDADMIYVAFEIEGKKIELYRPSAQGLSPLFNAKMLNVPDANSRRPVFIAESFAAAAALEQEVWVNHLQVALSQFAADLKKDGFIPPKQGTFSRAVEFSKTGWTRNELLYELILRMETQVINPNYPLGDVIWVAPVGGYATPWTSDFAPLAERDVYISKVNFSNRHLALQELLDVYACLPPHKENKVCFVLLPQRVSALPQENPTEILDINGIFDLCTIDGVPIPEALKREYDQYLRDSGKKRNTSPYIVEPFLRKNSWALLSGEEGVGKSYIAMALGMAIAAKGTLFWNWRVRHRGNKVLYIADDEMSESILAERMRGLRRMYRQSKNFILRQVHAVDLLSGGKDIIEREIANAAMEGEQSKAVNVLILDHLLKLTATLGDQRDHWPEIREWIENLNLRGIAVILLHHEFGGSKMMGSRLIANDAPARVHLERKYDSESDHLTVGISIPKNKGGKDQQTAKPVTLVIGKTPYWLTQDEKENSVVWKRLSSEARTQKIQELRIAKHTVGDIARICNVSKSTVEKWITEHLKNQDSKR